MALIVRAFFLRVPLEEVEAFAAKVNARAAERDAFYQQFGVSHESWHVQDTPQGMLLIGVTKATDPETAGAKYAASSSDFDTWYKDEVTRMSYFDPRTQPLGSPTMQVFEWSDPQQPGSSLCA